MEMTNRPPNVTVQLLLEVLHRVNEVIRTAATGDRQLLDLFPNYLHPSLRPVWIWDDSPFKMSWPRDWERSKKRGDWLWGNTERLAVRAPPGWGTIQ